MSDKFKPGDKVVAVGPLGKTEAYYGLTDDMTSCRDAGHNLTVQPPDAAWPEAVLTENPMMTADDDFYLIWHEDDVVSAQSELPMEIESAQKVPDMRVEADLWSQDRYYSVSAHPNTDEAPFVETKGHATLREIIRAMRDEYGTAWDCFPFGSTRFVHPAAGGDRILVIQGVDISDMEYDVIRTIYQALRDRQEDLGMDVEAAEERPKKYYCNIAVRPSKVADTPWETWVEAGYYTLQEIAAQATAAGLTSSDHSVFDDTHAGLCSDPDPATSDRVLWIHRVKNEQQALALIEEVKRLLGGEQLDLGMSVEAEAAPEYQQGDKVIPVGDLQATEKQHGLTRRMKQYRDDRVVLTISRPAAAFYPGSWLTNSPEGWTHLWADVDLEPVGNQLDLGMDVEAAGSFWDKVHRFRISEFPEDADYPEKETRGEQTLRWIADRVISKYPTTWVSDANDSLWSQPLPGGGRRDLYVPMDGDMTDAEWRQFDTTISGGDPDQLDLGMDVEGASHNFKPGDKVIPVGKLERTDLLYGLVDDMIWAGHDRTVLTVLSPDPESPEGVITSHPSDTRRRFYWCAGDLRLEEDAEQLDLRIDVEADAKWEVNFSSRKWDKEYGYLVREYPADGNIGEITERGTLKMFDLIAKIKSLGDVGKYYRSGEDNQDAEWSLRTEDGKIRIFVVFKIPHESGYMLDQAVRGDGEPGQFDLGMDVEGATRKLQPGDKAIAVGDLRRTRVHYDLFPEMVALRDAGEILTVLEPIPDMPYVVVTDWPGGKSETEEPPILVWDPTDLQLAQLDLSMNVEGAWKNRDYPHNYSNWARKGITPNEEICEDCGRGAGSHFPGKADPDDFIVCPPPLDKQLDLGMDVEAADDLELPMQEEDQEEMPVVVVTEEGSEAFRNLPEARKKYPSINPHHSTEEFTQAMFDGGVMRFESWPVYTRASS